MIGRYGISVLLTLLITVLPVDAELRQWTDENGVKHFSNKTELPEGVTVERSLEEKESHPGEPRQYRKTTPANRVRPKPQGTTQPSSNLDKAAILKEIRIREARLIELFDRIYAKRRYVKRQGKKDIDRIRRLNREIAVLEKNGAADKDRLAKLKEDRDAAKERLFNENLRTRKGVGEDIQEYKKIEAEIAALQKSL